LLLFSCRHFDTPSFYYLLALALIRKVFPKKRLS
jgi:hypothetical protein